MIKDKPPRIRIEKTVMGRIMESIAILFCILALILPIVYNIELMNNISDSYNIKGDLDQLTIRWFIWVFPIITLIMYIGISFLEEYPYLLIKSVKFTSDRYQSQYMIIIKRLRIVKIFVAAFFFYMSIRPLINIKTDLNIIEYLTPLILLVLIITSLITHYYKIYKYR